MSCYGVTPLRKQQALKKTEAALFQPIRNHLNILICFKFYTGLFQKVEVVLKLILKGFPIPRRKVKHTHSSTVHLKLFLTVHLGREKQTKIDIVSVSLFPSEIALNIKQGPCCPLSFLLFQIHQIAASGVGSTVKQGKTSVDMCNLCFKKHAGIWSDYRRVPQALGECCSKHWPFTLEMSELKCVSFLLCRVAIRKGRIFPLSLLLAHFLPSASSLLGIQYAALN